MGQVVIPPRPQFPGESDEAYQRYLHSEYYDYLIQGRDRSAAQFKETAIIVIPIVIVTIFAIILVLTHGY